LINASWNSTRCGETACQVSGRIPSIHSCANAPTASESGSLPCRRTYQPVDALPSDPYRGRDTMIVPLAAAFPASAGSWVRRRARNQLSSTVRDSLPGESLHRNHNGQDRAGAPPSRLSWAGAATSSP
jgi:hypothetical protein